MEKEGGREREREVGARENFDEAEEEEDEVVEEE